MIAENPTAQSYFPQTIEEIASSYTSSIVLRLWLGCVIDYIILLLAFLLPVLMSKGETNTGTTYASFVLTLFYFPVLEHLSGRSVGKLAASVTSI